MNRGFYTSRPCRLFHFLRQYGLAAFVALTLAICCAGALNAQVTVHTVETHNIVPGGAFCGGGTILTLDVRFLGSTNLPSDALNWTLRRFNVTRNLGPFDVAVNNTGGDLGTLITTTATTAGMGALSAGDVIEVYAFWNNDPTIRSISYFMNCSAPGSATVGGTLAGALGNDPNGNTAVDPGETARLTTRVFEQGAESATNATFSLTLDPQTALIPGSVRTTPIARDETYAAVGNVELSVAAPGVFVNDNDPDGLPGLAVLPIIGGATTAGGSVNLQASGAFTYNPPLAFKGIDSFVYFIEDADGNRDQATVRLNVDNVVWFIDNTAGGGGNGSFAAPFNTLAAFNSAQSGGGPNDPSTGDVIFCYQGGGAYSGGITLQNNQHLIGQGVDLVVNGITITTATANPTLTNGSGVGITLAQNNTIRGLTVSGSSSHGLSGAGFGTCTIASFSALLCGGAALNLSNGSLNAGVDALSSLNSSAQGIRLNSVGGSLSVSNSATLTNPSTGGLLVQNCTGAQFDFGAVTITGSDATLSGNSGATLHFADLDISVTGQTGLNVSGGGTLSCSGGTISVVNGTAVSISSTTIGGDGVSGGMTFESVSASGATNGIVLNTTGVGRFVINGNGSTLGSGGTIQTMSQSGIYLTQASNVLVRYLDLTNANTTGNCGSGAYDENGNANCYGAVRMHTVTGVTLDHVRINGTNENGINGFNVTRLRLLDTDIRNCGATGFDAGINITDLLGTQADGNTNIFRNTTIDRSANFNVFIRNLLRTNDFNGEPDRLEIDSCTISNSSQIANADGLTISLRDDPSNNGAHMQTIITNSTFDENATDNMQIDAGINSKSIVEISRCTITDSNTGINLSGASNSITEFLVSTNALIRVAAGNGVNLAVNGDAQFTGKVVDNLDITSSINNNPSFGIALVVDQTGTATAELSGNTISDYSIGILAGARGPGTGTASVTITSNTITTGGLNAWNAMWLFSGNISPGETNVSCFNLANNTLTTGFGDEGIFTDMYAGNTFQLQGFTGNGTSAAAVEAFLDGTADGPNGDALVYTVAPAIVNYTSATCAVP